MHHRRPRTERGSVEKEVDVDMGWGQRRVDRVGPLGVYVDWRCGAVRCGGSLLAIPR